MSMRRDDPFVNVYIGDGEGVQETFVHIRQLVYADERSPTTPSESQNGVIVQLEQFRSLMFHLRALDAQFRGEAGSTSKGAKEAVDMLPTIGSAEDDAESGTVVDLEQQQQRHQQDQHREQEQQTLNEEEEEEEEMRDDDDDDGDGGEATEDVNDTATAGQKRSRCEIGDELADFLVQFAPSDDAVTYDELDVSAYVPEPKKRAIAAKTVTTVSNACVRDELATLYAEELVIALPQIVRDNCVGCALGCDKNTAVYEHDECTMPRKRRVEKFARQILLDVDEVAIRDKLIARMASRHMLFDSERMYTLTRTRPCTSMTSAPCR